MRAGAYLAGCAVMLLFSVLLQIGMNRAETLVAQYYRSNLYLAVAGIVLLGVGVYLWREYARKAPALRGDVWFLLIAGALPLLLFVGMFFRFGGLGDALSPDAYTAANINSVALFLLPAAFWVRGLIAALRSRRDGEGAARAVLIVTAGLAVLMLVLVIAGLLLHIQRYDSAVAAAL